jgi:Tfp pilus assembly protein PilO
MIAKLDKIALDNKKVFLIILACLIVAYLDTVFFMKMQLNTIKRINPQIIKLRKDLSTAQKELADIQNLRKTQAETKQKLLSKTKKIISGEEVAMLLEAISELANKDGVKINQMKPSREPQVKQEKDSKEIKFAPLLIKIDLSCNYHHFGKFINDLENGQIFVALQDMKIVSQQADYLKQDVNLVLMTYVKK